MESPTTSRAKSLSAKLQELQSSLESEKADRNAIIDNKFRKLDDTLAGQIMSQENRFKVCSLVCSKMVMIQLVKDELASLDERLNACRVEREVAT